MGDVKAVPDAVAAPPARALADAKAAERRAWLLREGWTGVVLAALVIGFALWSPEFFGKLNWLNTSSTATEVLLLALGETFVIIAGGIDLSVGAVLGLAGMVGGWIMSDLMAGGTAVPLTVAAGFAAALAVGLAFGLLNGWLIARHNIPAFVVTLGTLGIATGLGNLVYNGQEISAIPTWVGVFGNTNLLGWIPVPVLIAAILCVVTGLALAKTRYGSNTYAIGDSREAAIRAGLRWQRHLVKIYAVSGLLAGIDGVLVMSQARGRVAHLGPHRQPQRDRGRGDRGRQPVRRPRQDPRLDHRNADHLGPADRPGHRQRPAVLAGGRRGRRADHGRLHRPVHRPPATLAPASPIPPNPTLGHVRTRPRQDRG